MSIMSAGQARTHRPARRLACALLPACLLAGCGGGFSLYYGGDYDGWAPSVSLAAAQDTVIVGQMVRLVAAAADENGIEYVEFYRLDGGGAVLLGSDPKPPYEWDAVAPDDGRASLRVFARATDRAGNWADSNTVSVSIVP